MLILLYGTVGEECNEYHFNAFHIHNFQVQFGNQKRVRKFGKYLSGRVTHVWP